MEGNIKVTFGSMEALASDIGRQVGNIEGYIENLRSQIANLAEIWEGGSAAGFQETRGRWDASADSLKQTLAKIQTAVMQSTEGYANTERRNTARWS